jgi:hypothetical protein
MFGRLKLFKCKKSLSSDAVQCVYMDKNDFDLFVGVGKCVKNDHDFD